MDSADAVIGGCERQRMDKRHLPRLSAESYRGRAFVHWTHTVERRATGWLTPAFHSAWSLLLLHASARFELVAPAYVLMPDHVHLLWLGLNENTSDQRLATEFLRKNLSCHFASAEWQRQAFDHVLDESEREKGAFQIFSRYTFENPVRGKLVEKWQEYPYLGCCIPGYPEFDVRSEDYWLRFWRCYNYLIEKRNGQQSTRWRSQPHSTNISSP